MTAFGSSDGSSQGAVADGQGPDMEWDLDVDAFLDDYLKELGPEAQAPDHFGNIAIDFAPTAAQPGVLGAWGAAAPSSSLPVDSSAQQAPTMLTGQLQAQRLHSQQCTGSPGAGTAQQQQQHSQQQQSAPPTRATRARKSAAGAAAATAAAAGAGGASSMGGGVSRATSTGASRGSRETKKEQDLKKHLALQEKNRRAQRRFRERQKQRVAELEEQVAALQAQLEAASSGKGAAAAVSAGLSGGAAAGAAACGGGAKAVRLAPPEPDFMQQDGKREAHASPRAVVGAQGPASSAPASDEEPVLGGGVSFDDALTLTVREGHPVQLSARELADMTPAELAKYYKAYVNELAGILVESDNPASQATQERVRRLVDEVCLLSTRAALCNPPGSKHFALTKVDDVPGQPADARVPQIARALDISQHQRKQLGQLRSLFLQKLARIAGDRQDINAQLAGSVPGGTGNRHLCSRYLAAHDSARRLRESLREEHILVLDFISTIYKHVFSSQQVAQFMIQSYPWTPDCLALSTWVAAEDGDADALGMLAADAQSKQQQAAQAAAAAATAAAAASVGAAGGPQVSSGGSGGSGNTLSGAPMGVPTPRASMGLPGAPGPAMFMPTAFASMQTGGAGMFGQPLMTGGAHHHHQAMMAGFNPAAALMHAPNGTDGMAGMMMMGQRWMPGAAGSAAQSIMQQQPMTHAGSGCLPISLRLPHMGASGSGQAGMAMGELPPAGSGAMACGGMSAPISPHVATMSSAATDM